jgi:acetyl coenzyme A synthetase (ADP forming)-like protein
MRATSTRGVTRHLSSGTRTQDMTSSKPPPPTPMATLDAEPVDVILRDGRTLRLRPPRREDADRLLAFFRSLSEQSLYLRFHGFPALDARLVEQLLEPDWDERGALLGELADAGGEQVVAVANYVRLRDRAAAEVAFAVADEHQRRGIGTRLLERLAERAAEVGIERFVAEVMAGNRGMLSVFEAAGFELARELEGGELEVQFPIAATEAYRARVDERDHVAVTASLRPFFEPQNVAVIGASTRRGTIGGELFRNILAGDFVGAAYPVNREGEPVAGVQGYRSIRDVPQAVDLAVIVLPGSGVLTAAEEALEAGVRALLVISAGFAEVGREGAERQERLLELVRGRGARLIGPNCLGIAVAGPSLNATFAARAPRPGNIGFSSQSGALGVALLEAAEARGLGLSAFVSIGNKADVSSNDLLEWWEDDPSTEVVLLYLESFGNPRRFGRLARRVSRRKPILALKSGTTLSGQRAASSHTAALAGSEAAVEALFHQAGVIRATSLEELIDVAALLTGQPETKGRRVGILTNAGGLGILCADACEAVGLELPSLTPGTREQLASLLSVEASLGNPVDMLGGATSDTYEHALPPVLADAQVDALIVLFVPTVAANAEEVAAAIERAVAAVSVDKPVLAVVMSAAGIPDSFRRGDGRVAAFAYPEAAARALGRSAERAEWLRQPFGTVPSVDGIDRASANRVIEEGLSRGTDVWLETSEVRELLLAYGLPLVPERVAASVEEAVAAAHELGFPVVVKTALAGAHKTEIGGIALDLADEAAVRDALSRIGAPAILQPMVTGSAELLAGMVQDPVFGPLVAFGPGGVFAELIGEAGFRIAPLTDQDAEELVRDGKTGKLVSGFRGKPPADDRALRDLLHRLGRLGEEQLAVVELDLNPVIAQPAGCVVVDARVRVRRPERIVRAKTW